ncbi:MAG: N-formylglutamate amidohydrolase [Sphingobium sp.]
MNSAVSQSLPGQSLLGPDDPAPVCIDNPAGTSPFLFIGDHAGNRVPSPLNSLGVQETELARHIGWDIGVAALGAQLAKMLDATFVRQTYSRLVIDCNRHPDANDAMPEISDKTPIPANHALNATERRQRIDAIHSPYHVAIAAELARRDEAHRETVFVALHSFTPSMQGDTRPWEIGILHGGGNEDFARAMLAALTARGNLIVGDNQPYAMDGVDYTVPHHCFASNRPYVEVEIRQDLLTTSSQITDWATILAETMAVALDQKGRA